MPKKARSVRMPEILLKKKSRVPLTSQLYVALRCEIISGRLQAGQRLPSTRILAQKLRASRNTILGAFDRLGSEGYIIGRVGSGTRVARPQLHTYLAELPRILSNKNKGFRQSVRDSYYPARTASLRDSEGNSIYLFSR